ncbi:hypothetical protein BegalDRAFT_1543 [Beggiatoa alba B18LD]|uniref:Uncharacterized protein n=1 Tax=Beggiatoa alba B18LD TaxID=395493 RepID=I3CFN1_9GAMM|nr:hypothetical protein [Beggiatoa alba]EIJ42424.1 hypothetical protein BegalDRAFT_1543 [Beggiatoa alba B18LD]
MSDTVIVAIVLGVVVIAVAVVFLLKDRISSANFKASKKGLEGGLTAHEQATSSISRNKIKGDGNTLKTSNAGKVDDNEIEGNKNKLGE